MTRNFLSIIVGLISCFLVIFIVEIIGHTLNPLPVDVNNPEEFRHYIQHEAPEAFYLLVLSGYAIGSFTGGMVTAWISVNKKIIHAMTVGGILMGLGVYNLVLIRHPSWVIVTAFFTFLPFAYLGGRIGKGLSTKKQMSH
jgi:hypothetical protein